MWMALLGAAYAQDDVSVPALDAQTYRFPVDAERTMWADDSGHAPDGYVAAKLVTGYMHAPLVFFYDDAGKDDVAIVRDALSFNAIASASFKRLRLGVDLPVYAIANGDVSSGGGLGDMALDLKGTILPRADFPIGLALAGRLKLPTGNVAALSSPTVGWEIEAIVDQEIGPVLLALNLGQRGGPKTELLNVNLDDQLFMRLGLGYALNERVGFSADVNSSFNWASFGSAASTPLEGMLGGYGRISDESPLAIRLGVGSGLSRGIGAPTFRGILSIGYEPPKDKDADRDGIVDRKDSCPNEPEDIDQWEDSNGCPDPDNDKDGIADLTDACRDIAEDKDGYKDDDGCIDPNTEVHVRFLDPDKKLAPGVQAVISGFAGAKEVRETGDEDFVVEMPPGSYTWTAQAPKFLPARGTMNIIAGPPQTIDLRIDPDLPPGEVRVHVVAPGKKPIPTALVSFDDGSPEPTDRGNLSAVLPAKSFRITARAEGYAPQTLTVPIRGGEINDIVIELKPSKVKVTKEKLEIKDKVFFELNKANIKPESFGLLDEIARILLDRPDILKLRIEGHTDSQGDDAANLKLSQDRAASVRQYFIDKGVTGDRLEALGFGETKPIDFGKNNKAYEKNRRVEFYIAQWAADQ